MPLISTKPTFTYWKKLKTVGIVAAISTCLFQLMQSTLLLFGMLIISTFLVKAFSKKVANVTWLS